jgi:hypothetical protein
MILLAGRCCVDLSFFQQPCIYVRIHDLHLLNIMTSSYSQDLPNTDLDSLLTLGLELFHANTFMI